MSYPDTQPLTSVDAGFIYYCIAVDTWVRTARDTTGGW
jgi:uncharacterized protein YraI